MQVSIEFDPCVPTDQGNTAGWWICISNGEWDTYKEAYYLSDTKPTQRQIRAAKKAL
jgi:hypothetical protein